MSRAPILFHCQQLLGVGHLHRAARLARGLARAGEHVLFVAGAPLDAGLDLGGVETIALPPLTAADESVGVLVLPDGSPPTDAYRDERRARLLRLLAARDPAVVLLELFPFGRHALAFELGPLLLAVAEDRARRGPAAARLAVSVRDVLVSKRNQPWHELAVLAIVQQWVDRVLVHGSPDLVPFSRTFGLADRLGDRLVHTGYLADPPGTAPRARAPGSTGTRETAGLAAGPAGEVVVSAGGGRVGAPLFRVALEARPLSRASALPWRLITGPYFPEAERAALVALTQALPPIAGRPAVCVESFRDDFPALLGHAALSVSQGGYNTVLDLIASGVRAVVVPFEGSGDEQPRRARLLAERGLLHVVETADLSPTRLAAAMDAAMTRPGFPAEGRLDLGGVARSVAILSAMVAAVTAARERTR